MSLIYFRHTQQSTNDTIQFAYYIQFRLNVSEKNGKWLHAHAHELELICIHRDASQALSYLLAGCVCDGDGHVSHMCSSSGQ
jgi:hypothetical protein